MDNSSRCTSPPTSRPRLSPQETAVIQALAWHGNNTDISTSLDLAPSTVGTLLDRIRRKYAAAHRPVPNQILLVRAALQDHVICLHHLLGTHHDHPSSTLPYGYMPHCHHLVTEGNKTTP